MSISFDGDLKGNLGLVGMVGVVRDHRGQIVRLIMEPLDSYTSHFVEVWAIIISIKLIEELSYVLIIEDSLNAIELLKGSITLSL